MSKVMISSYQDIENLLGKSLGSSSWLTITQEQINHFAETTLDQQWIHTDPERAKTESPFGHTIAHGYLTLSLISHMIDEIVEYENVKMIVNYGIESLRFSQPVIVDSQVRLHVKLHACKNLRGTIRAQLALSLEIKDQKKPAYQGIITLLYTFND